MPSMLFDPTFQGLAGALTLHEKRHEVVASNLANVETPGFRARDVDGRDFKTALEAAFAGRAAGEIGEPATPEVVEDVSALPRADGNTVDLDFQMAKLSANGERYVALARILGQRIALLRQAIEGSR
jgi:flagellar basal-body rod protein FlgB